MWQDEEANAKYKYHSLPADRFEKPVDDLTNEFCTHSGAANHRWVTAHAGFPHATLADHGRHRVVATEICLELRSAVRYFLDSF